MHDRETSLRYFRYLRDVVEGIDNDQTQCDEQHNSGRNDICRNQKAHPRHDHKNGGRQIDIEQIRRYTSGQSYF